MKEAVEEEGGAEKVGSLKEPEAAGGMQALEAGRVMQRPYGSGCALVSTAVASLALRSMGRAVPLKALAFGV